MISENVHRLSKVDREHLELIREIHAKEPTLTADQIVDRLKAKTHQTPSEIVMQALYSHLDPYNKWREMAKSKRGD